jgi:site-specific DNA recombinase
VHATQAGVAEEVARPRVARCRAVNSLTSQRGSLRAVAYVRVSLEREGMISPQLQMFAIEDYCKRRGYIIVKVLEDLDLSGRFWKRRQVEEGSAMVETDQADILVVWRWSRVSRNRLDWASRSID